MKLHQNARHFASRKALETPVVRSVATSGLVRLHTRVFLGKADPAHADEREAHLDGLFEATVDSYLRALQDGYSEAQAREITHIQANFDFYNHGWTEMMEFPTDELESHYDRYGDFFERWDVTIDDPLGQFAPPEGLPEAPSTPERLEDPDHPTRRAGSRTTSTSKPRRASSRRRSRRHRRRRGRRFAGGWSRRRSNQRVVRRDDESSPADERTQTGRASFESTPFVSTVSHLGRLPSGYALRAGNT